MKKGDLVLFYHSNAKPPGVAGVATVENESYPDHTSWDKKSKYFDPKSTEDNPRWFMVDVKFKRKFKRLVPLDEIKGAKELKDMRLVQKGARLSVMPITKEEYEHILTMV
jgi:predicted RNA-binding protein with PUA-like domain